MGYISIGSRAHKYPLSDTEIYVCKAYTTAARLFKAGGSCAVSVRGNKSFPLPFALAYMGRRLQINCELHVIRLKLAKIKQ